mgnify:CR=1 FL=1
MLVHLFFPVFIKLIIWNVVAQVVFCAVQAVRRRSLSHGSQFHLAWVWLSSSKRMKEKNTPRPPNEDSNWIWAKPLLLKPHPLYEAFETNATGGRAVYRELFRMRLNRPTLKMSRQWLVFNVLRVYCLPDVQLWGEVGGDIKQGVVRSFVSDSSGLNLASPLVALRYLFHQLRWSQASQDTSVTGTRRGYCYALTYRGRIAN